MARAGAVPQRQAGLPLRRRILPPGSIASGVPSLRSARGGLWHRAHGVGGTLDALRAPCSHASRLSASLRPLRGALRAASTHAARGASLATIRRMHTFARCYGRSLTIRSAPPACPTHDAKPADRRMTESTGPWPPLRAQPGPWRGRRAKTHAAMGPLLPPRLRSR
jgi:hypothetical protein